MKLTKKYSDGSYDVADNLPCGENSHEFKKLLIDKLGKYEENENLKEIMSELDFEIGHSTGKEYIEGLERAREIVKEWI